MKRSTVVGICLLAGACAFGDPAAALGLPFSRYISWEKAGYPGAIPDVPVRANVKDYGTTGDGRTDDAPAVRAAIDAAKAPGAVFLPAGTYLLRSSLVLRDGIVLRGEGPKKTRLLFDFGGRKGDCIKITRYKKGRNVPVVGGMSKGSRAITVTDASSFRPGDVVEIQQENDPAVMYTDPRWKQGWESYWATEGLLGAVGQLFRVKSVSGKTLNLDRPLHIDFTPRLHPSVRKLGTIEQVGVEDLYIKRLDAVDNFRNHNISIRYGSNCWVRNVESVYANACHVGISSSLNIEIRDSYFHEAHFHKGGGRGYGVALFVHTTDCLIENNVFESLRHAMQVQGGSNGNVFAYNYSYDAYGINRGRRYISSDISLHGYYPFMNLFEGNIVQYLYAADHWGPAGPGNTFFRNRVEKRDLTVGDHSHHQNVIANELTGGSNRILIDPSVRGTIVHGNDENGRVRWSSALKTRNPPPSLYRAAKPAFFGDLPWPALGTGRPPGKGTIPAEVRVEEGRPVSGRREEREVSTGMVSHWKFDEVLNGVSPDTEGRNPAQLVNGAAVVRDPERGMVLDLATEGAYVRVPDSPSLDIRDRITLAAWVKIRDFSRSDYPKILIKTVRDGREPWELYALDARGRERLARFLISTGSAGGWYGAWDPGFEPPPGEWFHLAATYDGNVMSVYINGEKRAAIMSRDDYAERTVDRVSIRLGENAEPLLIGAFKEDGSGNLNGCVDDVRIYNYALSEEEIADIYESELGEGEEKLTPPPVRMHY